MMARINGYYPARNANDDGTEYLSATRAELINNDASIICDLSECIAILKEKHPDIEDGYGYVILDDYYLGKPNYLCEVIAYDHPGLTTNDHAIAKALLKKYGSMPLYTRPSTFKGHDGFIVTSTPSQSGNNYSIRYSEKVMKKRKSQQEDPASPDKLTITELNSFLLQIVRCNAHQSYALQAVKHNCLTLSGCISKPLFVAELVVSLGNVKTLPEYDELATRWRAYKKLSKLSNEAMRAVKLLEPLFATN
jgi:hypothetical protein